MTWWSEHVSHTDRVPWSQAWPGAVVAVLWLVWTIGRTNR